MKRYTGKCIDVEWYGYRIEFGVYKRDGEQET